MGIDKSSAKADIKNNRLYIKVANKLTRQDLDNLYIEIRFCVADLAPGFSVITDLSDCSIAMLSGVSTFKKISTFLIEKQVGTVVRVMNSKSLLFHQLLNLTSRTQGYKPINVATLEEAENQLNRAEKRSASRFRLYQQEVKYKTASLESIGFVLDISASGCAITSQGSLPLVDDSISLAISFTPEENFLSTFETTADVVAVNMDSFTVHYADLDELVQEQLWRRLVHESKCDLKA